MGQKHRIYITRKIDEQFLVPLADIADISMWESKSEPVPREILIEKAQEVDALFTVLSDKIDEEVLAAGPSLKIVANLAVGFDNIDLTAAKKHDVIVTNTPDVLSETTADLTWALLMATARRIVEASDYLRAGKWQDWSPFLLAGTDVYQKKIGIVGMGRIGSAVAKRAKGFDMDIMYHNRSRNQAAEEAYGAAYVSFDELIETADYIVSLVPLTNETAEIFNEAAFAKMKSSAIFVNVSRGAVVDETALYNALKNKTIAAAGLDVFAKEPLPLDHPFLKLDNAVLIPHIGSASIETRTTMIELCLQNIANVLTGKEALTEVKG